MAFTETTRRMMTLLLYIDSRVPGSRASQAGSGYWVWFQGWIGGIPFATNRTWVPLTRNTLESSRGPPPAGTGRAAVG